MIKTTFIILLSTLLGCSQINTKEREAYTAKKGYMRHGLIPVEGVKEKPHVVLRKTNVLPSRLEKGKKLYEEHCQKCHGPTGEGNGPMAKVLDLKPKNLVKAVHEVPNFKLYIYLSRYQDQMPGWTKALNDEHVALIEDYIRDLAY